MFNISGFLKIILRLNVLEKVLTYVLEVYLSCLSRLLTYFKNKHTELKGGNRTDLETKRV